MFLRLMRFDAPTCMMHLLFSCRVESQIGPSSGVLQEASPPYINSVDSHQFDPDTSSDISGWARESSFHFCIITGLLSTHLRTCFNKKKVGSAYIFSIQPGQESELESHMTVP